MAKRIKEIPIEEADRICMDVQLWWRGCGTGAAWGKDFSPEEYRDGTFLPCSWSLEYGIEIDTDKPEYDPPTSST